MIVDALRKHVTMIFSDKVPATRTVHHFNIQYLDRAISALSVYHALLLALSTTLLSQSS
jgi:hypothetical protein